MERAALQFCHGVSQLSWVFMTIGSYRATGPSIGLPDKRKPMPPSSD